MKIFRIIMVLIGTIGVADTAVLSMWSNINLGIMLPAIIGAPLIIVGIFFKPLRSFTARALAQICVLRRVYSICAVYADSRRHDIHKRA